MPTLEDVEQQIEALEFVLTLFEMKHFNEGARHKATLIDMKLKLLQEKRKLTRP